MKNFKKVLALVLAVVMLLSFATVASAKIVTSDFYKDTDDIDYTEAVDVLGSIGVLNGFPDDTFRPDATITRAQAAKIIAMFDNGSSSINGLYASANPFTDCVDNWAESFIAYCAKVGIIAGVGGTKFAPDANVTGVQFLKMALVVLGYDAKVEGLEGKNWDVNTLALAKKAGLTASLGVKFDYSKDLKRQEAAVIMLDALRAQTVVYGSALGVNTSKFNAALDNWNSTVNPFGGVNINGMLYMTVAGAVQTGDKLGKVWGLSEGYTEDAFYRPYRTWELNGTVIGEYMYPAAAEYTTAYTGCEVLVDLGVAKTNISKTVTIGNLYINGFKRNGSDIVLKHTVENTAVCDAKEELQSGAQGTLSQVFYVDATTAAKNNTAAGYRITEIDTWLGKVVEAKRVSSNRDGHLSWYTTSTIDVWSAYNAPSNTLTDPANAYDNHPDYRDSCFDLPAGQVSYTTYEGEGLSDGDYVLLTYSCKTKAVESVEIAKAVAGTLDGYKYQSYPSQTRVDGTYIPDALHFHLGYVASKTQANIGATKMFIYDTYGNVIGMTDPAAGAAEYLVIDRLWLHPDDGEPVVYADVVTLDAKVTEKVKIAAYTVPENTNHSGAGTWAGTTKKPVDFIPYFNDNASNAFAQSNGYFYDWLDTFSVSDKGLYYINETTGALYTNIVVVKGDPAVNAAGSRVFGTNASTKYLIHEDDGTYTAVTGFRAIDSLKAANAQIIDKNNDGIAEIVYIYGNVVRDGDNSIAYVTGPATNWVEYYEGAAYNKMTIYVDGVATDIYVDSSDVGTYFTATTWTNAMKGFYKFHYVSVGTSTYAKVVAYESTTAPGLNTVYTVNSIGADVLNTTAGYFAVAENAVIYSVRVDGTVVKEDAAKYVDTYGLDQVKLVFNADGEVAAVYSLETIDY